MFYSKPGYTWYMQCIPCIYHVYSSRKLLASAGPLCCPCTLGSIRPRLPSDPLSFGHREAAHARLEPLWGTPVRYIIGIYHVYTMYLYGPLFIHGIYHVYTKDIKFYFMYFWEFQWSEPRHAWGQLNVEGLVYPVNSFLFHDSSSPQATFPNGAEENQKNFRFYMQIF